MTSRFWTPTVTQCVQRGQKFHSRYGSLDADVARGLALRMDHGSHYLSDHFLKQRGAFKGSMQHEPDEEVSWCNDVAHV